MGREMDGVPRYHKRLQSKGRGRKNGIQPRSIQLPLTPSLIYLKTNETITIFTASSHFSSLTSFERSCGIGGGRQRCGRRRPRWPRWQWRSRHQRSTTTHSGRTSGKLRCATDISCRMEILHPESACILYKMVVTGGCGCPYASIFNQ